MREMVLFAIISSMMLIGCVQETPKLGGSEQFSYQCMGGKECDDWCEHGIDSVINDTFGKTGQLWNTSEAPCCCSISK